jgi:quinohemoprotein ethanol dehydrogenase
MRRICLAALLACAAAAATGADVSPLSPEFDPKNWSGVGRTAGETHYSPLAEINRDTVNRLRLAWSLDLDIGNSQSTPLAVDGVVYVAAGYSQVFAVDARNGKLLWHYDPGVLKLANKKLRAGSGIRGLAYSKGRLFVGTHDGRMIALDTKKGTLVWSTQVLDANDATFISGAPRIINDKVVVGFGDSGTTRGAIAAFDALTGNQVWRWTSKAGGGAIWNAITFDPELNRLYAGTGNARGTEPNAQACSVIALNADNGEFVWQFDASKTSHTACDDGLDITLATLSLESGPRNVILHAPKDGSIYVLDRDTGQPISAKNLGEGAHNHFAQAFSPKSGLVYLPITDIPASGASDPLVDFGKSALLAWDPVRQRAAWLAPSPGVFSGGALATAGDLVFQGQSDGHINAYSAAEGRRVWSYYAATAALGTPITFAIGKQQFVALLTGPLSGAAGSMGTPSAKFGWDYKLHPRRLLTFALDGKAELPATAGPTPAKPLDAPDFTVDDALAAEGAKRYASCSWCHGAAALSGGGAPDLRASAAVLTAQSFAAVVRGGLDTRGMPSFAEFSDHDLDVLRHFIRQRARLATRPDGVAPPVPEAPPPAAPEAPPAPEPDKLPPGSLQSDSTPPKN